MEIQMSPSLRMLVSLWKCRFGQYHHRPHFYQFHDLWHKDWQGLGNPTTIWNHKNTRTVRTVRTKKELRIIASNFSIPAQLTIPPDFSETRHCHMQCCLVMQFIDPQASHPNVVCTQKRHTGATIVAFGLDFPGNKCTFLNTASILYFLKVYFHTRHLRCPRLNLIFLSLIFVSNDTHTHLLPCSIHTISEHHHGRYYHHHRHHYHRLDSSSSSSWCHTVDGGHQDILHHFILSYPLAALNFNILFCAGHRPNRKVVNGGNPAPSILLPQHWD